jgi:hypothetical protein
MHSLGIPSRPTASTFLTQAGPVIPDWYAPFLYRVRAQVASGREPVLQLAPKFDDKSGELKATQRRIQLLQEQQYNLNEQEY